MIKLERVRFQTSKPFFTSLSQKGLRMSIQNIVRTSKVAGRAINETCMEWEENFYLPAIFEQEIQFQIYNIHSFGYNPQQLSSLFRGIIIIDNHEQNYCAWEIFDHNKERVGFLSATIKIIRSVRPEETESKVPKIFDTDPKVVQIKSIVVHLPAAKNKKVFVTVNLEGIEGKTFQTKARKSETGELVYLQQFSLYKDPTVYEAKFCIFEMKDNKELIASGKLTLVGDKHEKRVILTNNYERLGQIYVQASIMKMNGSRHEAGYSSFFMNRRKRKEKSPQHGSHQQKQQPIFSSMMDFSLPETPKSSRARKHHEVLKSRYHKVSVVHQNTGIVFNKQKRFGVDTKHSQEVSYLRNRSFEFKTPRSKFYKGAGMGFGGKADFTKQNKDKPGVGSYNLPSVFDRY